MRIRRKAVTILFFELYKSKDNKRLTKSKRICQPFVVLFFCYDIEIIICFKSRITCTFGRWHSVFSDGTLRRIPLFERYKICLLAKS